MRWCKLHVFSVATCTYLTSHPLLLPFLLPPPLPPSLPPSPSPPSFPSSFPLPSLLPFLLLPPLPPSSSPSSSLQALSEALLQVRADLVETTQKTLEGQARREQQDANVQQLVDKKTSELQVCDITTSSGRCMIFLGRCFMIR